MPDPVVALQVGAVSFVDEGVTEVLDTVGERAGVNALFLATPTWTRGTGGRQVPGFPLPDHGKQEYDLDWVGGNYARVHPEHYGRTAIGPAGRAPEHPDFDLLGDVIPEAKRRGMQSFAWIEESSYADELRRYPNFLSTMEVDIWNKPARRPCFNNPDYRNWHLAIVEDYLSHYEIDGLAWCSERPGPLTMLMQGPTAQGLGLVTCFCRYCREIAADRNIDWRRAQEGYRKLVAWNARVAVGDTGSDGAFVSFWRLLLQYPELISWQSLWTDSQHQMYRDIYGTVKAARPEVQVGWHVYHNISFSPFYRADQDYSAMSHFSDFIKVVSYDNCAGPRFHTWIDNICHSLFADATPEEVYPLVLKILGLEEAAYESLPSTGFSADYVRRETERAVAGVEGRADIWPGIDVDIPVGRAGSQTRQKDITADASGISSRLDSGDQLTRCTPESVKAATLAAFEGGAQGVVISRKYSEMRLDNLSGVGAALRELQLLD
ncbi:hypothetical protein GCM10011575_33680 [Microlunatus endophyticus]|uniref:Uncharacterized protein n=1 Tax=Microlunatus endophyticus TaxID=1716077 RepID=A0A917W754_9ACTN|nr:hypothetical protein [Microlunatus endophyticus]GGL72670.1 hypothetical protein GCM10011575_33680 [Microlunatus endophyticus]